MIPSCFYSIDVSIKEGATLTVWVPIGAINKSDDLNIIIKSDVHGSSEAIKNALNQIKHDEVKIKIILSDVGMVTETDVNLAKASNATFIAFNVKPSKEAKKIAEQTQVKISSYNIIYDDLLTLPLFPHNI